MTAVLRGLPSHGQRREQAKTRVTLTPDLDPGAPSVAEVYADSVAVAREYWERFWTALAAET